MRKSYEALEFAKPMLMQSIMGDEKFQELEKAYEDMEKSKKWEKYFAIVVFVFAALYFIWFALRRNEPALKTKFHIYFII